MFHIVKILRYSQVYVGTIYKAYKTWIVRYGTNLFDLFILLRVAEFFAKFWTSVAMNK